MPEARDTDISTGTFIGWARVQNKRSLYKETDKEPKACPSSQQLVALSKPTSLSWLAFPICGT